MKEGQESHEQNNQGTESQENQHAHNENDGQLGSNINNYIQNLDVANVLAVDLASLDNHQTYIDPSIAAAYKRAAIEAQRNRDQSASQIANQEGSGYQDTEETHEYIPGIPPLPPGADPKKMCPFCQRTFSHPGSMGRHLDLKKGTRLHPADLIERMRADVKRRGDAEKVKQRRRVRARKYNAREDVKERSKVKRRTREKIIRAKRIALTEFVSRLGKPQLQPHPSFPRLVLYFLSPDQWPHDPPTLETYRLLCGFLNSKFLEGHQGEDVRFYDEIMQKVHTASENWLTISDSSKQEIWIRELRRAAEDSLRATSLYDLGNRDNWILQEAHRLIETNANKDDSGDDHSDEDDENDQDDEAKKDNHRSDDNINTDSYYNQDELAAVAEAVVNNANQHHEDDSQRNEVTRNDSSALDPQLMN